MHCLASIIVYCIYILYCNFCNARHFQNTCVKLFYNKYIKSDSKAHMILQKNLQRLCLRQYQYKNDAINDFFLHRIF